MKKLVTWNVNGIRAVMGKGFLDFIKKSKPDVLCLQEIKADPSVIPEEVLNLKGYNVEFFSAEKKGYSGTLTLSKEKPLAIEKGLSKKIFSSEGRTLITHFKNYILLNCYFPNGSRDHSRVPYKLDYCAAIGRKVKALRKKYEKPVIVCGDYNTAHHPIDLKNPKSNKNTTGFLEIERKWMDKFTKAGNTDVFRNLYPQKEGAYSWWSYRGDCRARNIGWRIDYFFINNEDLKTVKDCQYLPKVMGSDHCPLELKINL